MSFNASIMYTADEQPDIIDLTQEPDEEEVIDITPGSKDNPIILIKEEEDKLLY